MKLKQDVNWQTDEKMLSVFLDESSAWAYVENYGQTEYGPHFDLLYTTDKISATVENKDTWVLKSKCTLNGIEKICTAKITIVKTKGHFEPKIISLSLDPLSK